MCSAQRCRSLSDVATSSYARKASLSSMLFSRSPMPPPTRLLLPQILLLYTLIQICTSIHIYVHNINKYTIMHSGATQTPYRRTVVQRVHVTVARHTHILYSIWYKYYFIQNSLLWYAHRCFWCCCCCRRVRRMHTLANTRPNTPTHMHDPRKSPRKFI